MWFGIPGTSFGVELDVPDPVQFGKDMINKVGTVLTSIVNFFTGFLRDAASNIGSGVHGFLSDVPNTLFSGVIDGIKTFWKALRGDNS